MDGSSQMSAAHNSSPIERAEAILWPEGYSMEERGLQYSKGDGTAEIALSTVPGGRVRARSERMRLDHSSSVSRSRRKSPSGVSPSCGSDR